MSTNALTEIPEDLYGSPAPVQPLWPLVVLAAVVAAAIRSVGLWKDLWLDEIWSIQIASRMGSPVQVFTLHHEINHYLNTLWLYWIGPSASNLQYHMMSFLCGVASVAMAVTIGRRRSVATGWIALLLFAFSYELVVYSTEARGYASVVLWTLVAFDAFERYTASSRVAWAAAYGGACILGILSQPIFTAFLAAAAVTSTYRIFRSNRLASAARDAILLHGFPLLSVLILWWTDMRLVSVGGGTPAHSLIGAYATALAWAVGTIHNSFAEAASCLLAMSLVLLGLRRSSKEDRVFFFGVIVAFPLLLVVARRSDVVYTRHFMIGAVFLLLLFSELIGAWWTQGRRITCIVIITAYVAVNLWSVRQFAEVGRGEYVAALQEIVNRTPAAFITIGADQDFRVGTEVLYYLPRILGSRQGAYVEQGSWPNSGPQWVIVERESFESATPPVEHFTDDRFNNYDFFRSYPTAPLSGLHWLVYRNRGPK